jgi:hypothetical protein
MNSEERQMITGLFDRMRGVGQVEKDRDAEALIQQAVRQMPDAPYMLVQSVLVQEHALQQAGNRIEELEERVRALEAQTQRSAPQPSSGGFLGGLFGGGSKPAPMAQGSVPAMGSGRPMVSPAGSPWGQQPRQAGIGAPMQSAQAAGGGGGFLKSAMATAAGVAGGMLLADSIRGMMSGNSGAGSAQASPAAQSADGAYDPGASTADATQSAQYQDPNQYEADNYEEAGYDDGGDVGGDIEI